LIYGKINLINQGIKPKGDNSETANAAVAKFPDGDAFAAVADVSKRNQVFDAFDKIVGHFGDLHVVVNNAGVAPTTPLDTITEDQFINTFSINVGGTIWGSQAAHKYFKEFGHGGKIINAASQAGVLGNPSLYYLSSCNLNRSISWFKLID
jgi:meso-butanediol dehydrogenase/(S,S)-butanediol dehydrogenase/diacetyl reductase